MGRNTSDSVCKAAKNCNARSKFSDSHSSGRKVEICVTYIVQISLSTEQMRAQVVSYSRRQ